MAKSRKPAAARQPRGKGRAVEGRRPAAGRAVATVPPAPQDTPASPALLDRIVAALPRPRSQQAAAQLASFTRRFFANVPEDDLADSAPGNLAGAAAALLGFVAERRPGRAKVRVYNPEARRDGWGSSHSVVEIVNDDMPFLVDSVTAELTRLETDVRLVIHPVFAVTRDKAGRLAAIGAPGERHDGSRPESIMQIWIGEVSPRRHAEIVAGLSGVLVDVRAAVGDWRTMRQRCRDLVEELERHPPPLPKAEVAEALKFLEWLDGNNFTYLGYREYSFAGQGGKAVSRILPDSGLGILTDSEVTVFDGLRSLGTLPADVQDFIRRPVLLRITKANRRATVHRPVHMDTIAVKAFNAAGEVIGERLFIGLFTSAAYSMTARDIPLLRQKVEATLARAGFAPNSHDGKALAHILDAYPRDELFQVGEEDLYRTALGILHLQERRRVALFVRRDPFERFVSALIYVPRDRFDTNLRLRLQELMAKAYGGEITAYTTQLSDAALARLHLMVRTTQGQVPKVDEEQLEQELAQAARSWTDQLEQALVGEQGESEGLELARRYLKAFPPAYQAQFGAGAAVKDIERLERVVGGRDLALRLYQSPGGENQLGFKVYVADQPIALSDILPVLENMGLKVLSEVPYTVTPQLPGKGPQGETRRLFIHDFGMVLRTPQALDLAAVKAEFHRVFGRTWRGRMESDGLNRLVLRAGLDAREITVLRAYARYLRQIQAPFTQETIENTLAGNPAITALLVQLFHVRFDPARAKGRDAEQQRLAGAIRAQLEQVTNLDEDRIFRRYLNLIKATLRTNFYQPGDGRGPEAPGAEKQHLSFKFDARALDDLPQPRPFREIFVYSVRVEGVHLRFGPVARGGLRWSDRRDDFRTEVLGLVKAQQVKNAVIVPVGSKGGFVLKSAPPASAGRDAFMAEGVACYRTFLRGLLDLTDNFEGHKVVPPAGVVRHDGDDPYLVVAADKGTATFSDYANAVSADYGFWLGDAFASGGSVGYDHKVMGITAKGAWESVKRHFREMGKDIQAEDFTVAGVGDMSGDVFGNGMLLSPHIRLLAAFDHRNIFVDPDPDPAVSLAERQRLFALPRSSWMDYDATLISRGGGVFDRRAKEIKTTPEMRQALNLAAETMTPAELMRAILLAPVELLWFGGIGTYVKAATQSQAEVGDRANDAIRVNGRDLKARVIGEGANLGMTQPGRVEYALAGGRLNTDSIDNSAGVDCSDHEVNIKILTGLLEQKKKLTRPQRDKLLARMTGEVGALVLRDNYLQTQAISATERLAAHLLDRHARYMRGLEKAGKLDRALEYLPNDEMLAERLAMQRGLTRPELAILLSYAKIVLYEELLDSDLPDDPALEDDLRRYFPLPLQKAYGAEIGQHRLRREIVSTMVTNDIVNRMGMTFTAEIRERTGLPTPDIARAYLAAREIFAAPAACAAVEALDGRVPAAVQAELLVEIGRLVERATAWLLRARGQGLPVDRTIRELAPGVAGVAAGLDESLTPRHREELAARGQPWVQAGVPAALARRIAAGPWLIAALDIVRIGQSSGLPLDEAGAAYFGVGDRFGFDWLRRAAAKLSTDTAWDKLAVSAVVEELGQQQAEMAARILGGRRKGQALPEALEAWAETRRPLVARAEQLMGELGALAMPSLAMLTVASRQLRSLLAG